LKWGFCGKEDDYFGYIFRIIENDKRNIDLIYNKRRLTPASVTEAPNQTKYFWPLKETAGTVAHDIINNFTS
jgi:hypothetical protein